MRWTRRCCARQAAKSPTPVVLQWRRLHQGPPCRARIVDPAIVEKQECPVEFQRRITPFAIGQRYHGCTIGWRTVETARKHNRVERRQFAVSAAMRQKAGLTRP